MKKKDFDRLLRRYLRAIIDNKENEFFDTIINEKIIKNMINNLQLEELFFYRFFTKSNHKLIKRMMDGPTADDKKFASIMIAKMFEGWNGHAEMMFQLFHDDNYRKQYLEMIDESKKK